MVEKSQIRPTTTQIRFKLEFNTWIVCVPLRNCVHWRIHFDKQPFDGLEVQHMRSKHHRTHTRTPCWPTAALIESHFYGV